MSSAKSFENDVKVVTDKLQLTHIDLESHWEGLWEAAFDGDREKVKGFHGAWTFFKDADTIPSSSFNCIRAYNRSGDGKRIRFYSWHKSKPASGRATQRKDGIWEHSYERSMSDPYFSCNLKLGQSELSEGKPACTYWRSVPISDNAIIRLQPALPPMEGGVAQQYPCPVSEHAAASVWAMEGYFMDGKNRWSMGPIYSMQNLHLLTHMFIHEYATAIDPDQPLDFHEQPMKEARPMLDADPDSWMDGGTWEGTMTDLLWDEDGEMCKCSPRPAAWHPPSKKTGRRAHDSLLSLKKLLLYPDMMYGYYPERLPPTREAAEKRKGVRVEIGGMLRSKQEFHRVILRYSPNGEALSLTEEVYRPVAH
ncbi:hypothetical protein ABBQ32_005226 [Trebouxia sp. C0010 RCD-2024]